MVVVVIVIVDVGTKIAVHHLVGKLSLSLSLPVFFSPFSRPALSSVCRSLRPASFQLVHACPIVVVVDFDTAGPQRSQLRLGVGSWEMGDGVAVAVEKVDMRGQAGDRADRKESFALLPESKRRRYFLLCFGCLVLVFSV